MAHISQISILGVRWLSGRASDGARGRGFKTYLPCVVSFSKTLYSPKVLVIVRKQWLRLDMTEKLLTDVKPQHKQTQQISIHRLHVYLWLVVNEHFSLVDHYHFTICILKIMYKQVLKEVILLHIYLKNNIKRTTISFGYVLWISNDF